MTISRFSFPTPIHFGPGARKLVADHLKAEDIRRPLIVTDRGIAPLPLLAEFVASLKGQDVGVFSEIWGNPVRSQVRDGAAAYKAACSECHGNDLAGDGFAPALTGADFMGNWNDLSLGDLFERIRISMPQNAPGSLSRQDNADVLSYILNKGNYPPGKAELPTQTEALNGYKFLAVKP
jgi:mono/diheme cytochrome c family protein